MKNWILMLSLFVAVAVQAQQKQTLKDLLYSGKLKRDSTGVIRSTDDLSSKIDTSAKKETDSVKVKVMAANVEPEKKPIIPKVDNKADNNTNATPAVAEAKENSTVTVDSSSVVASINKTPAIAKTNTKLWKEYNDSLVKTLKAEVLNSKQIKKNTYFLIVDYEIAADGQVTFTNIISTPENKFLQAQVKQIMDSTLLTLNPLPDSGNQLKKVKRKQQIIITKE